MYNTYDIKWHLETSISTYSILFRKILYFKDFYGIYKYARYVAKGKWEEGEPILFSTNNFYNKEYKEKFNML